MISFGGQEGEKLYFGESEIKSAVLGDQHLLYIEGGEDVTEIDVLGTDTMYVSVTQTHPNQVYVDWGDGSRLESANLISMCLYHFYPQIRPYKIKLYNRHPGVTYYLGCYSGGTFRVVHPGDCVRYISLSKGVVHRDSDVSTFQGFSRLRSASMINEFIPDVPTHMFDGCKELLEFDLPEGTVNIKNYAFQDCNGLQQMHLPSTLKSIGQYAFSRCKRLASISFPENLEIIDNRAFIGCSALSDITLPPHPKVIRAYAFSECNSLEHVDIPSTMAKEYTETTTDASTGQITTNTYRSLQSCMFLNCKGLKSVTIPSQFDYINSQMFDGCSEFEISTIPSYIKILGYACFRNTKASIRRIPSTVIETGSYLFSGCEEIEDLIIDCPTAVNYMLADMPNLKRVYLTNNVTTIKSGTCTGIYSSAYSSPFKGCPTDLEIFCQRSSKPSGWDSGYNVLGVNLDSDNHVTSPIRATVHWGVATCPWDE